MIASNLFSQTVASRISLRFLTETRVKLLAKHVPSGKRKRMYLFAHKPENPKKKKKRSSGSRRRERKQRSYLNRLYLGYVGNEVSCRTIAPVPGNHFLGIKYRSNKNWMQLNFPTRIFAARNSMFCSWHETSISKLPYTTCPFYYISDCGEKTGILLYKIHSDPRTIIATFFSTCFRNLLASLRKHFDEDTILKKLDIVAAIVAYYTVSQDHTFLRRSLILLKQNRKVLVNYLQSRVASGLANANTRFVFASVWKQASWLTFRSKIPRDINLLGVSLTENYYKEFGIFNRRILLDGLSNSNLDTYQAIRQTISLIGMPGAHSPFTTF
jgi:hypothetical protein